MLPLADCQDESISRLDYGSRNRGARLRRSDRELDRERGSLAECAGDR